MSNLIVKNAYTDYSENANFIYSKAFKLAIPINGIPNNNRVTVYSMYLTNGYLALGKALSLSGSVIRLWFMAEHTSATNRTCIVNYVDTSSKRDIKVISYPNPDESDTHNFDYVKVTYTDETGTMYLITDTGTTVNTAQGMYYVEIDTEARTISGQYVFGLSVSDSGFDSGTTETVFSATDSGIFVGKTLNSDDEFDGTNTSQRARLQIGRLEVDGIDKSVITTDPDKNQMVDYCSNSVLFKQASGMSAQGESKYDGFITIKTSNGIF